MPSTADTAGRSHQISFPPVQKALWPSARYKLAALFIKRELKMNDHVRLLDEIRWILLSILRHSIDGGASKRYVTKQLEIVGATPEEIESLLDSK